jgi:hypothetical protein
MEPVLKAHFNNFKKAFEISSSGLDSGVETAEEARIFERFVNYVLFSMDYPDIFTADPELLDFVSVGGAGDTGIDGIGVKINERLVRSIDEVKEITEASKKVNVDFVFVQSKMRPSFDTKELNSLGTGVRMFFSEGYLPENSRVKDARDIKDFIYSDEKVISKFERNPRLYLYYVGTGTEPTDENLVGTLKWVTNELKENHYFESVDVKIVGGRQLIKFCRELENKFEVQMNIIDIFPLIVDPAADVKKAYAFTCSALEFLKFSQKKTARYAAHYLMITFVII